MEICKYHICKIIFWTRKEIGSKKTGLRKWELIDNHVWLVCDNCMFIYLDFIWDFYKPK